MASDPVSNTTPDLSLPEGWTRNADGSLTPPIITCPKCGMQAAVFVCNTSGCPMALKAMQNV